MLKLNCPSCGGEVQFISTYSVSATCPWCRSLLVRHDVDLEKLGTEAELPADISVIQVGAGGIYNKVHFQVVGRLVIGWSDGRWNEWYVCFEDGRDGWLAEFQGEYAVCFQDRDTNNLPKQDDIALGTAIQTKKCRLVVNDMREVTCLGVEGELPMTASRGRAGLSVDLTGNDLQFGTLEYSKDGLRLFTGRYVTLDELRMTGLRNPDG